MVSWDDMPLSLELAGVVDNFDPGAADALAGCGLTDGVEARCGVWLDIGFVSRSVRRKVDLSRSNCDEKLEIFWCMESEEEAGWIRGSEEREVDVVAGAVGVGRILSRKQED